MTIATTATNEMNITQVVTTAFRRASLVSLYTQPTAQQLSYGKDELGLLLDQFAAGSNYAKKVTFETITLQTGVWNTYSLDAATIDIVGDAAFIDASVVDITQASGEIPVEEMSREEWQGLTNKGQTGRPLKFFQNRVGAQVQPWIWPIPSAAENNAHIRFQVRRWRANVTLGTDTIDVERYWVDGITWKLSAVVAAAAGRADWPLYDQKGDSSLALAKSRATQNTPVQLMPSHDTGWGRR